ncbi:hypothetical protein ACP275_06G176800 [Erythranthe tilingii]
MEDLFGQIECRSKSDLIVMRILRSAMDKAHEKLQSKDGPIEFLHERSTFYELAAILVEGGLGIVQEETDILEDRSNKILSDLMEIKHWLEGRIQDMKQLIVEKDIELIERLENESQLRQALELKDRELFCLHEKNEENNSIQDLPIKNDESLSTSATQGEEDIFNLKNSVDQQFLNIKQKLEDEKNILTTERRTRKSRVSSPNLSFDFLDKEIFGSPVFAKDDSNVKPLINQNVLIKRMSSDIDILKESLDLAFGRMHSAEVLPLEKQWRWTLERDIESILVKGFISNLRENFDAEYITKRNHNHANQTDDRDGLRVEIEKLEEERDALRFQIFSMEEIYELLFRCKIKDITTELCCEGSNSSSSFVHYLESTIKEDIYAGFLREMAEAWQLEKDGFALEALMREDIYQFVIIEAVKQLSRNHFEESKALKQLDFQEYTPRSRMKLNAENQEGTTPRSRMKLNAENQEGTTPRSRTKLETDEKLDSLLKCLEVEEDLMLSASSEIKEHGEYNSLVILDCEEVEERNAIEWLLTDDKSTFRSVNEKLERALQQLYTSKELLVELEESLEESEDSGENYQQCEKTRSFLDTVCQVISMQFQIAIGNIEHVLHKNLDQKCTRVEVLKSGVDALKKPVVLMKTRKTIYEKAFVSRCHNLKIAETEVDLLGDQVESLLCLLERIYVQLNQNATVLSAYFEVYDILKLIKRELNNGRAMWARPDRSKPWITP